MSPSFLWPSMSIVSSTSTYHSSRSSAAGNEHLFKLGGHDEMCRYSYPSPVRIHSYLTNVGRRAHITGHTLPRTSGPLRRELIMLTRSVQPGQRGQCSRCSDSPPNSEPHEAYRMSA